MFLTDFDLSRTLTSGWGHTLRQKHSYIKLYLESGIDQFATISFAAYLNSQADFFFCPKSTWSLAVQDHLESQVYGNTHKSYIKTDVDYYPFASMILEFWSNVGQKRKLFLGIVLQYEGSKWAEMSAGERGTAPRQKGGRGLAQDQYKWITCSIFQLNHLHLANLLSFLVRRLSSIRHEIFPPKFGVPTDPVLNEQILNTTCGQNFLC